MKPDLMGPETSRLEPLVTRHRRRVGTDLLDVVGDVPLQGVASAWYGRVMGCSNVQLMEVLQKTDQTFSPYLEQTGNGCQTLTNPNL